MLFQASLHSLCHLTGPLFLYFQFIEKDGFVYNDFIRSSLGLSLEESPMAIKQWDTDKKLTGATSGYNKEEDTIDGRDLARKQT